jgi:hypothetical protein
MSLSDDFREELNQTVLIESYLGNDGNDDIYSEGTNYDCYVQERAKVIRDRNNNEVVSMAQIDLDGTVVVNSLDRITYDGRSWPIQQISKPVDEVGYPYATIVYL